MLRGVGGCGFEGGENNWYKVAQKGGVVPGEAVGGAAMEYLGVGEVDGEEVNVLVAQDE